MLKVDDLGKALEELKRLYGLLESVKAIPECKFKEALILEIQRKLDRESIASTEEVSDVSCSAKNTDPRNFNPLTRTKCT